MIIFNSISQGSDRRWTFTWTTLGINGYTVVLNGREVAVVSEPVSGDVSYTFEGTGDHGVIPPPIEIVPIGEFAESEIFRPFARFQWYFDPIAAYYILKLGSVIQQRIVGYKHGESAIYSLSTPILANERQYNYQLFAYNIANDASDPDEFAFFTAYCPIFDDRNIVATYDEGTNAIVISEVP